LITGYEGERTPLDRAVHDKLTIGRKVPCVCIVVPTRTSACTTAKTTSVQLATHFYGNTNNNNNNNNNNNVISY
jgi:hypothetical protein